MDDFGTDAVRALARQAREAGAQLREEEAVLARRVADVPWRGAAATAMRARVSALGVELAVAARQHDDAAAALEAHADAAQRAGAAAVGLAEHALDAAAACGSPAAALLSGVLS